MSTLSFPFLSGAVLALLGGITLCCRKREPRGARRIAIVSAVLALVAFAGAAWQAHGQPGQALLDPLIPLLKADAINALPMVFFAGLTLLLVALAPERDSQGPALAGMLLLCLATGISYAAAHLPILALGWWLTAMPFLFGMFGPSPARRVTSLFLLASAAALTAFAFLLQATSMDSLSQASRLCFAFLIAAVALRKGLFPLHSWVVASFEHGPLIPTALLFNGHLGALLIARTEAVQMPGFAQGALEWVSLAALITALIASIRSFAEKMPRRLLAFIVISQASFILAGLAAGTEQGVTGALVHWFVVTAASSGLIGIVRILEVRVMDVTDPQCNLGLAVKAPRLATFFLICALALIGLPGTLGYTAEDLLFHGALQSHSWMGVCLLVATAFNAINLLRLFSLLFQGVLPKHVIDIPDALPRERWPLALCVVFLLAGGILPGRIFPWISTVASGLHHDHGPAHGAEAPHH